MKLETDRLKLRTISITDIGQVHALHSLPETDRYNTMGIPAEVAETEAIMQGWIQGEKEMPKQRYTFYIENREHDFVGVAGIIMGKPKYLSAELWYKMHPAFWNKGYATEVVLAFLRFGFGELKLHRMEAGCVTKNTASVKVLEKAGFKNEGLKRRKLPIRGEWYDGFDFGILAEEFIERAL